MDDGDAILRSLHRVLPDLRKRFGLASLGLFGSAARGETKAGSDVDVLVTFEPTATVTLITLARVQAALEEALSRPVDLVEDHPRLRPSFRRSIERDLRYVA